MARLFPFRPSDRPRIDGPPRFVDIDDDEAGEVFAALSSETARSILTALYAEPTTASDLAEQVGTSLQNARYHLDKLQAAGLIEQVDTWYSSRGTEMTVYAPSNEPLVVAAGRGDRTQALREAITRVLGGVGILGVVGVLVNHVLVAAPEVVDDDDAPEAEVAVDDPEPARAVDPEPEPEPETVNGILEFLPFDLVGMITSPGGLLFVGGLVALVLVLAWWYVRRYRPEYKTG